MSNESAMPFYQKLCYNLVSLSIICIALIYGKPIILPILFSVLLASLLLPVTNYLAGKKLHKTISILIPLFVSIILGLGVIYFLSSQIVHFMQDVPVIKERLNEVSHSFQEWIRQNVGISVTQQNQYVDNGVDDLKEKATDLLGLTVVSLTGILSYFVLMPVCTFLILYYRSTIKEFLVSAFKNGSTEKITDVLTESTTISQRYLTGLLIETTLVFSLNTVGFLILGIKYPIFLALLAALLNLVPYVGMLVANVLCMLITLVSSEDASQVLWVAAILAVVQFLDNNFGMPLIVGNKVRINGLVTIVGILIGGALCGIPGMFLAIPGLAFLKVIFDKVPGLNHWGVLLSDADGKEKKLPSFKSKSKSK